MLFEDSAVGVVPPWSLSCEKSPGVNRLKGEFEECLSSLPFPFDPLESDSVLESAVGSGSLICVNCGDFACLSSSRYSMSNFRCSFLVAYLVVPSTSSSGNTHLGFVAFFQIRCPATMES